MTTNKEVKLIQKPGVTLFQRVNAKWIDVESLKLGRYMKAVNEMIGRSEVNLILLRDVLGVDPNSPNGGWDMLVKEWWSNINVSVPPTGKTLQIGLIYDVTDRRRQYHIDIVRKYLKATSITDEELKNICGNTC